ncbi:MAG: DUF5713 family protein [Verrucomicrobiota bacterium]
MPLTNDKMQDYPFLQEMYDDDYFPPFLVDKCKAVLMGLCEKIESTNPETDEEFLELSHAATEEINDLQDEFLDNDSEIETGAREILGDNFEFITKAYGFHIDREDVIATRDW